MFLIPKAIRVYQFSIAAFNALLTESFVEVRVKTVDGLPFRQVNQSAPFERLGNTSTLGRSREIKFAADMEEKAETDGFVIVHAGGRDTGPASAITILADKVSVGRIIERKDGAGVYGSVLGIVRKGQKWEVKLEDIKGKEIPAVPPRTTLKITFVPLTLQPFPTPDEPQK